MSGRVFASSVAVELQLNTEADNPENSHAYVIVFSSFLPPTKEKKEKKKDGEWGITFVNLCDEYFAVHQSRGLSLTKTTLAILSCTLGCALTLLHLFYSESSLFGQLIFFFLFKGYKLGITSPPSGRPPKRDRSSPSTSILTPYRYHAWKSHSGPSPNRYVYP